MSSLPKAGPSRIPTFGSRLPQPQPKSSSTFEPTKQDIGKTVRVVDKEGILRFIGNVHFSSGIWCGIELPTSIGKNDGLVQGVRYFACPASHGVMAPLAKTTLVDRGSCESLNDDVSGPYSMLFIDRELNRTVARVKESKNTTQTITKSSNAKSKNENLSETVKIENDGHIRHQTISKKSDQHNHTFDQIPREINNLTETIENTTNTGRNDTYDVVKSRSYASGELDKTITKNSSNENTLTNSAEDITQVFDKENNSERVQANRSCENTLNESFSKAKRRRTSVAENSARNLIFSEERRSLLLHLSKLTSSTPARQDHSDNCFKRLRISSISTCSEKINKTFDESHSKRNSLERDESSLGILTPDQLEFTNFPGTRSPSLEYEINLTNPSKSEAHSPRDDSLGLLDDKCIAGKSLKEDVPGQLMNLINCSSEDQSTIKVMASRKHKENTFGSIMESHSPTTSIAEPSLGILDEHMINLSTHADFTSMKLLLDNNKSRDLLSRLEETPSPEELPFDPTPIVETDPKIDSAKVKSVSSFVTSITSITSLDTGYQGDGEMSRPASRGAENSPLTRRPVPRPQTRRPDPMTDSDFYTESDADVQEENPLRGDRKAQVIDGTLYGVDPQAAADIYVNNKENMDSSGIFTDLETNPRTEEDSSNRVEVPDVSPSDSTKTISANSQNNIQEIMERIIEKKSVEKELQKENPKKRNASSPVTSSSTARYGSKIAETPQKFKIAKREVVSKVKTMLETVPLPKVVKKPVNKWDAVMNKISKNEPSKTNLKEVKSKVFSEIQINTVPKVRSTDSSRNSPRAAASPKIQNNKFLLSIDGHSPSRLTTLKNGPATSTPVKRPGSAHSATSSEKRRVRQRPGSGSAVKSVAGSNVESSIHSSLSDLSTATVPQVKPKGTAKKRTDVVQVTQVLTANKLPVRNQQQTNNAENKKIANRIPSPAVNSKTKRPLFSPKEKKQTINKECGRVTAKGGRISPSVRPPLAQVRAPVKLEQPPVAEALAILVHHLVFNVEAFQVPSLRKQVQKYREESEKSAKTLRALEETLMQEKIEYAHKIEQERAKYQNNIARLIENHREKIEELNGQLEQQRCLLAEKENSNKDLCKEQEQQLLTLKKEFEKLQRTQKESIDILREENEAIRDKIDEKQLEIDNLKHESKKLKNDYESREIHLKDINLKLREKLSKAEADFDEKLKDLIEENHMLREENNRLLSYGDDKGKSIQEVQSLRVVLEMKQNEIGKLRKSLAEATQRADILEGAEEKARVLQARCEDLELQLERKNEFEKSLLIEKQKLQDSIREETNQKKRIQQFNEELQWKIKQNKEVISKVLNQSDEVTFNRSILSSSLNERHSSTRLALERTLSLRDKTRSYIDDRRRPSTDLEEDQSPPGSPKVKAVVEKSESVSYVLDLDDSPDVVASRIVRRSFRNSTPPKSTPTKSPLNKRPRMRNALSQSASSSAILTSNKIDLDRPKSASNRSDDCISTPDSYYSTRYSDNVFSWHICETSSPQSEYPNSKFDPHINLDEDNEEDIQLPALPSEETGAPTLPSPKHLAGEAMVSESQSEDESTSSSQL